jgi:PhnB protein
MQVQPYLFFDGRCEEALDFYRTAVDAKITHLMRFKEAPPDMRPAGESNDNKVMHVRLHIGDTTIFASDGRCQGNPTFEGFALSIAADSDAEAKRLFTALSEGGKTVMPLGKTFFASSFGMVVDRYGVSWMLVAGAA